MKTLLIDDQRNPADYNAGTIARTYAAGRDALLLGRFDKLCLDSDLGLGQKSGTDILNFILNELPQEKKPLGIELITKFEPILVLMGEILELAGYEKLNDRNYLLK